MNSWRALSNSPTENAGVRNCSASRPTTSGKSAFRHLPSMCRTCCPALNSSAAPTPPSLFAMANLSSVVVPRSSIIAVNFATAGLSPPESASASPPGKAPLILTTSLIVVGYTMTSIPFTRLRTTLSAIPACANEGATSAKQNSMRILFMSRLLFARLGGHIPARGATVLDEVFVRHAFHICERDVLYRVRETNKLCPVARGNPLVQFAHDRSRAIETIRPVRLVLPLRPLQFLRGDALGLDEFDLLKQRLFDLLVGRPRREPSRSEVQIQVVKRSTVRTRREREAAVDQSPIEARFLPVAKDRIQHGYGRLVGVKSISRLVRNRNRSQLARLFHNNATRPCLLGLLGIYLRYGVRCFRIGAVVLLDQAKRRCRVDVPHHNHGGVVGPIERVVEIAQLLDRNVLDIA